METENVERVALVTGACSGLGQLIGEELTNHGYRVFGFDKSKGDDVRAPGDVEKKLSVFHGVDRLDVLVNCAGVNEQEWIEKMEPELWDSVMDTNAKGIFMMTKACLPLLIESRGTVLNIVSNASHMPMTCSLAYNASKGAAHIMTLQMARELTKRFGITVFGISPNKLSGTGMSLQIEREVLRTRGWEPGFAADYQLKALLAGAETPPGTLAEFVGFLLSSKERHRYLTGCVLPYGA